MQVLVTIELKDSYKSVVKETMESELPASPVKQDFDARSIPMAYKYAAPEIDADQISEALDGMADLLGARFIKAVTVQQKIELDRVRAKNLSELAAKAKGTLTDLGNAQEALPILVDLGIIDLNAAMDAVPSPDAESEVVS